jgi:vancomycin resistance protein VanJ
MHSPEKPDKLEKSIRIVYLGSWLYPVLILVLWLLMYFSGDSWWLATMLLFGPRWMLFLPLLLMVPLAILYNWRLLVPVAVSAILVSSLVMSFNLPFSKMNASANPPGRTIRVMTCNLDSAGFDTAPLMSALKEFSADVVALQECPEELKLVLPTGWSIIKFRGLAVLSRYPLTRVKEIQIKPQGEEWPGTYLLHATVHAPGGDLAFCSIHLPTPRFGLMKILDKYTVFRPSRSDLFYRETENRRNIALELRNYVDGLAMPVVVAGDFNTPVESQLYRSIWGEYRNAFSETGLGYGWTQRANIRGFSYSARIDHILTGKGLVPRLSEVGPDIGSGHLPLIADISY